MGRDGIIFLVFFNIFNHGEDWRIGWSGVARSSAEDIHIEDIQNHLFARGGIGLRRLLRGEEVDRLDH